jgi:geranylgeranyl pyrophosphate synthase
VQSTGAIITNGSTLKRLRFEMTTLASTMVATDVESTRQSMKEFGNEIGMAFQIVDDILDFTGEEHTLGKPIGSDLLNGMVRFRRSTTPSRIHQIQISSHRRQELDEHRIHVAVVENIRRK